MVQPRLELAEREFAKAHDLMHDEEFVRWITLVLMIKEQESLNLQQSYLVNGNTHQAAIAAGYLQCLEEFLPSIRSMADAYLQKRKETLG